MDKLKNLDLPFYAFFIDMLYKHNIKDGNITDHIANAMISTECIVFNREWGITEETFSNLKDELLNSQTYKDFKQILYARSELPDEHPNRLESENTYISEAEFNPGESKVDGLNFAQTLILDDKDSSFNNKDVDYSILAYTNNQIDCDIKSLLITCLNCLDMKADEMLINRILGNFDEINSLEEKVKKLLLKNVINDVSFSHFLFNRLENLIKNLIAELKIDNDEDIYYRENIIGRIKEGDLEYLKQQDWITLKQARIFIERLETNTNYTNYVKYIREKDKLLFSEELIDPLEFILNKNGIMINSQMRGFDKKILEKIRNESKTNNNIEKNFKQKLNDYFKEQINAIIKDEEIIDPILESILNDKETKFILETDELTKRQKDRLIEWLNKTEIYLLYKQVFLSGNNSSDDIPQQNKDDYITKGSSNIFDRLKDLYNKILTKLFSGDEISTHLNSMLEDLNYLNQLDLDKRKSIIMSLLNSGEFSEILHSKLDNYIDKTITDLKIINDEEINYRAIIKAKFLMQDLNNFDGLDWMTGKQMKGLVTSVTNSLEYNEYVNYVINKDNLIRQYRDFKDYLNELADKHNIEGDIVNLLLHDLEKGLQKLPLKLNKLFEKACLESPEYNTYLLSTLDKSLTDIIPKAVNEDEDNIYEKIKNSIKDEENFDFISQTEDLTRKQKEKLIALVKELEGYNNYLYYVKRKKSYNPIEIIIYELLEECKIDDEDNLHSNIVEEIIKTKSLDVVKNSEDILKKKKINFLDKVENNKEITDYIGYKQVVEKYKVVDKDNENIKDPVDPETIFINEFIDICKSLNIDLDVIEILLKMIQESADLEYIKTTDEITKKQKENMLKSLQNSEKFQNYLKSKGKIIEIKNDKASLNNRYQDIVEEQKEDNNNNKSINVPNKIVKINPVPQPSAQFPKQNIFINLFLDTAKVVHLIKFFNDKQNNTLVDKYVISKEDLFSINKEHIRYDQNEGLVIRFDELNKIESNFIGIVGRPSSIINFLTKKGVVSREQIPILLTKFSNNGTGVYMIPFIHDNINRNLLILWSNNLDDFNKVSEKRNYVRLLRYLTQLSNHNIVCLDNEDLSRINIHQKQKGTRQRKYITDKEEIEKERCEVTEGIKIDLSKLSHNQLKLSTSRGKYSGFHYFKFHESKVYYKNNTIKENSYRIKDLLQNKSTKYMINFINLDINILDILLREILGYYNLNFEINNLRDKIQIDHKDEMEEFIKNELQLVLTFMSLDKMTTFYGLEHSKLIELVENNIYSDERINVIKLQGMKNRKEEIQKPYKDSFWRYPEIILTYSNRVSLYLMVKKLKQDADFEFFINETSGDLLDHCCKILNKEKYFYQSGITPKKLSKKVKKLKPSDEHYYDKCNLFQKQMFEKSCVEVFNMIYDFFEKDLDYNLRMFYMDFKGKKKEQFIITKLENPKKTLILDKLNNILNVNNNPKSVELEIISLRGLNYITYELAYREQLIEESKNEYNIYEFLLPKDNIEALKEKQENLIKPMYNKLNNIVLTHDNAIVEIILMKNNKILIVANTFEKSCLYIYQSNINDKLIKRHPLGTKIKSVDFDEDSRTLLLLFEKENNLQLVLYFISENCEEIKNEKTLNLTSQFGITQIISFKYEASKKSLWVVERNNDLKKIDIKNEKLDIIKKKFNEIYNIHLLPQTSCLIIFERYQIFPLMTDTLNILSPLQINISESELRNAIISLFENQIHLLIPRYDQILSYQFTATLSKSQIKIKSTLGGKIDNHNKPSESILDYYFYVYDKFPIYSLLQPIEDQLIEQHILIYLDDVVKSNEIIDIINKKFTMIEGKLRQTYKPNPGLNLGANHKIINSDQDDEFHKFCASTPIVKLGKWIQELICFLPIQIARAEDNLFQVLTDGASIPLEECNNVYDLKAKISLGLYEALLNTWKGKILVISSMGKQSTGKSYTLNHLSGANFAISGARCTDGCWLTMKVTNDCLYILLDFEGLGSIERTEQEDMLLSVFNAAISNATLYKTEYRLDREVDNMFSRFNMGGDKIKGSDKIFKGEFIIVIKDVAERDIEHLDQEFREKIITMMLKEKEKNFIDMLYKSGFSIFPFPSLETTDYYDEMDNLKNAIQTKSIPQYDSGKDFQDTLKLILAKMYINDFTALNRQEIDLRIKQIQFNLDIALSNGFLTHDLDVNKKDFILRSYDNIAI
jgi:hypothetical protein